MKTLKTLIPLSILCAVLVGHSYIDSAWTEPVAGPIATTNTPAPLNVGTSPQTKTASLGLDGLIVFGDAEVDGTVKASTSVWSRQYCDESGGNCSDVSGISTSKYDSGWITSWSMASNGLVVNHGLGVIPDLVILEARARVADGPWVVGDVLHLSTWGSDYDNNNENWGVKKSASSISLSVGTGIQGFSSSVKPSWADIRIKAYVF